MEILDGKKIAAEVKEEVRAKIEHLGEGARPGLTIVQVGEDPASTVYIKSKVKMSAYCGIESNHVHLPADISEADLLQTLEQLGQDPDVHGILLQLPIPKHIDQDRAIMTIKPEKDVDGFHPVSMGLLAAGKPRFVPCTPLGIRELLVRHGIEVPGKHLAVIGRSIVVGKPLSLLMMLKGDAANATVTVCHSRTKDIPAITRTADIVVAAMGRPQFLTADMVKDGAVVVDVGINRVDDPSAKKGYRLVGDVDFDAVAEKASFMTPVPGGVGPMTVAMLMANTLTAYSLQVVASNAAR
ncbi:MAG: bifunctional methylenetetrahydrofolate dehydrogenase/methenyltetrahydrofolate cyclohydrolase FolD [Candidatus Latescibacterota bacterium]|nr:MAG: bifunctional methylenetetrahydrofolate dehydrogenase/methenyltetrahydrofolate cyclohydrolase FolD [Candidatus Latescibacterota bacterium]